MNQLIGLISDIHSNAIALKIAIDELINKKVSKCIVLGDLLTYGTEPNEVIELLLEFSSSIPCIFIKGNHEQFYFDMEKNINPIKYKMPDFVKESIFWTYQNLDYKLSEIFIWHDNFIENNVYFSHANPFGNNDWTYMNSEENIINAAGVLNNKNIKIGVFGHTHRNKNYLINSKSKKCELYLENNFYLSQDSQFIINVGSIGQPRGSRPSVMLFKVEEKFVSYKVLEIKINNKLIIDKISKTTLSMETKNKLNSFWEVIND